MAGSNDHNDQDWINQKVSGQYNQVAGRDIIIQAPADQDDKPSLDNPNLITCPACGKFGVFRDADLCPTCHYSFLNERLAARAEARRLRETGLAILSIMAFVALAIALQVSASFKVSFLYGLGWGVMIVLAIFTLGHLIWARFTTWYKFRRHKI